MCPSTTVSPLPEDIGLNWTGEQVVACLERMICGDPLPANVRTEVNPYSIPPWLLSDSFWYFISEDHKATEAGYWKASEEDYKICTDSPTIGSRTTLQFYIGEAPKGEKTNWLMHAYKIDQKRLLEINKGQDSSSLCKVFLDHVQTPNHEEQKHVCGGFDVNDKVALLNAEDNNYNWIHPTRRSQVISKDDEHGIMEFERHLREPSPDNTIQSLNEIYDFSRGDYLELNDLDYQSESLSYTSESSSCSTLSSSEYSEYFDSSALLRDLEDARYMQPRYIDNQLTVAGALIPTHLDGEYSGAEQQLLDMKALEDIRNMQNAGDGDTNEIPRNLSQDEASSSTSVQAAAAAAAAAATASAASTERKDEIGTSRSRNRIAKLRKKYLCFIPF